MVRDIVDQKVLKYPILLVSSKTAFLVTHLLRTDWRFSVCNSYNVLQTGNSTPKFPCKR